jgi:hypothetical protein
MLKLAQSLGRHGVSLTAGGGAGPAVSGAWPARAGASRAPSRSNTCRSPKTTLNSVFPRFLYEPPEPVRIHKAL